MVLRVIIVGGSEEWHRALGYIIGTGFMRISSDAYP